MLSLKTFSIPLLLSLSATSLAQSLTQVLGSNPDVSSLVTVLQGYPDLTEMLSGANNITFLAPSNEAFATFINSSTATLVDNSTLSALLSYHVLEGIYRSDEFTEKAQFLPTVLMDKRFANFTGGGKQVVEAILMNGNVTLYSGLKMNSSVSTPDVTFDGGVIHVIDSVLTLPMNVSTTAIASNLTALAGALMEVDLVNAVDTSQSVTIFAPNNGAFQAIGNLLPNLDNDALTSILTYHVVPGVVGFSSGLTDGQELTTLEGGKVTIRMKDDMVFVNGAKVILADVITNNGVVHVIDNVLNPNNTKDEPETGDATQPAAFPSATRVSDIPYVSGVATTAGRTTTMPTSSSTSAPNQGNAASSLGGNIAAGAVMGVAIIFALAIVA